MGVITDLASRFNELTNGMSAEERVRWEEFVGDAQSQEAAFIQGQWSQRLARASRQASETLTEAIRKAKSEAWSACANAHLEAAATGDYSLLDDPYAQKES